MKSVKITKGKFEISMQFHEDETIVMNFVIPKQEEGINADDYTYLIEHIAQLSKNMDGKYSVEFQGLDTENPA